MKPILCMGLMVCDILAAPLDAGVFERDSSPLQSVSVQPGGDALNVASVLARFGCDVRILGCVGQDFLGNLLVDNLRAQGVDVRFVVRREYATSTSIVLIPENGERHFAYYGKSNSSLCESDLSEKALTGASHLHFASVMALDGFSPESLARVMQRAKAAGMTTSLDMTYRECDDWLAQVEPALPYVDLFMPSFNEAKRVFRTEDLHEMRLSAEKYGMRALVVKCGERGSFATDFREEIMVPTFAGKPVIDATGAGDTFCAGFLRAYLDGMSLRKSLAFASAAAACCLGAVGATAGVPDDQTVLCLARERAAALNIPLD